MSIEHSTRDPGRAGSQSNTQTQRVSSIPAREADPGDPITIRAFVGRTGTGQDVVIDQVGAWLDIRFRDGNGDVGGFSLNPKYAAELTVALVGLIAERAQ